ncbi:hypothetical protein BM221_006368 [Beauveria bassiana]|uniref:Uncharacterized protein n=1 Tax=Beauveria bassiana TaxID=176275 RepID=A0A2N6NLN8_BEABA|nr:hypothetical protein BM221_006368 [Beauveria bassiana]
MKDGSAHRTDAVSDQPPATPIYEYYESLLRAMRAYKVFLIVKTGRNADQCGLFFETSIDRRGTIVQVTGGGRGGMRLQRQTETALDARTWDDARKDHVGWVMEARFQRVWDVVRLVPPPGKRDAKVKTAREWTELVTRELQAQGVMENSRENEATVHEETESEESEEDEGEPVEEEQGEPLRLGIVPRVVEEESEISEEE